MIFHWNIWQQTENVCVDLTSKMSATEGGIFAQCNSGIQEEDTKVVIRNQTFEMPQLFITILIKSLLDHILLAEGA